MCVIGPVDEGLDPTACPFLGSVGCCLFARLPSDLLCNGGKGVEAACSCQASQPPQGLVLTLFYHVFHGLAWVGNYSGMPLVKGRE